jgi:hypothetical protein
MNVSRPAPTRPAPPAVATHGVVGAGTSVDVAFAFAVNAHGDQRYGTEPYAVHLQEVMAGCVRMGFFTPALLMAAALHDVIEDTALGQADIATVCGGDVGQLVAELSHDRGVDTVDYLAAMSDGAFSVKLADRLANIERMGHLENSPDRAAYLMAKYQPEMPLFAAEAKARGLEGVFAILQAAFQKTSTAIRSSVDAYTLQLGRDRVEEKAAQVAAVVGSEADGSVGGGAFVSAMGGKKPASPTSLSPTMAVRKRGPVD